MNSQSGRSLELGLGEDEDIASHAKGATAKAES